MSYRVETENAIIMVSGSVSVDQILALRSELEDMIVSGKSSLNIDLSKMESAHSAFLSLMLCLLRKSKSLNKEIKFTGMSQKLRSLASISQLSELSADAFVNLGVPE